MPLIRLITCTSLTALLATLSPASEVRAQIGTTGPEREAIDGASGANNSGPTQNAGGPDQNAATQSLSEIVVTGTLLTTHTVVGTTVSTVDIDTLTASSPSNLADAINQLPQVLNSSSPEHAGPSEIGGNFLNLRSLGPVRTLVLLDGERFVPSGNTFGNSNVVNVDSLPQGLVKSVDIVTGGASATYGSDAVAGVVNFILDKSFTGVKVDAQVGETQYGDNQNYKVSIAGGAPFADDKGHLLVSFDISNQDGVPSYVRGNQGSRPWNGTQSVIAANPAPGASPPYILLPNARVSLFPVGGVVVGGPFTGTAFNPNGTTYAYNFGTNQSGLFASGGNGWNQTPDNALASALYRVNLYTRVGFQITPNIEAFVETTLADTNTHNGIGSSFSALYTGGGYPISVNNGYLPRNLQQSMLAAGQSSISVWELAEQLEEQISSYTERGVAGFNWTLGDKWSWKSYFEYGQVGSKLVMGNDPNLQNLYQGINAVVGPGGKIVCASTLITPTNGCVPINILGNDQLTGAQQRYAYGNLNLANVGTEQVAESRIAGSPIADWAGDVQVALGGAYRLETLVSTPDSVSQETNPFTGLVGGWGFYNQPPISGSIRSREAFVEIGAPLLKDVALADSLDVDLAARYTDYSVSGGVTTWKAGLNYAPVHELLLRAAQSRDIRAPSVPELYQPPTSGFATVYDPAHGNTTVAFAPITSGNPQLRPEVANTTTVGATWTPHWVPGLSASIDYYHIDIKGVIAAPTPQQIVNECAAGLQTYCSYVTRSQPGNVLLSVLSANLNLGSLETNGFDANLSYTTQLSRFGMKGDLTLRAMGNYILKNTENLGPGTQEQQYAGDVAYGYGFGVPHFNMLMNAAYDCDHLGVQFAEHYVGGGLDAPPGVSAYAIESSIGPAATISGQWWTDLTLTYRFDKISVYGTITNLFNSDPPIIPASGYAQGVTNYTLYETLGRAFVVGVHGRW